MAIVLNSITFSQFSVERGDIQARDKSNGLCEINCEIKILINFNLLLRETVFLISNNGFANLVLECNLFLVWVFFCSVFMYSKNTRLNAGFSWTIMLYCIHELISLKKLESVHNLKHYEHHFPFILHFFLH